MSLEKTEGRVFGKDKHSSEVTLFVFLTFHLPRAAAQIRKPISGLHRKTQTSSQVPEQLEVIGFCCFFFSFLVRVGVRPGQWGENNKFS